MECKITSTERRKCGRSGFTIVEMMVSASIGVVIVGGLVAVQLYGNFSFASLYNYTALNNQSHVALDKMTMRIRQTSSLTSFSTNSISFTNSIATNTLTYTYSPNNKTLTEIYAGATNVLLTGCNSLTFSMYQRNPISNSWDQVVATNAAQCKLLQVEWNCSRSLRAGQTNESEVMESSKIVIRN